MTTPNRIATIYALALAGSIMLATGCIGPRTARSYLPIGADAHYGNRSNDGVTWTVAQSVNVVMETVEKALRGEGYDVDALSSKGRALHTAARTIAGDTTMSVTVQFLPIELPEPGCSVVLTATYSVASRNVKDEPVLQRPNSTSPMHDRLVKLGMVLRGRD